MSNSSAVHATMPFNDEDHIMEEAGASEQSVSEIGENESDVDSDTDSGCEEVSPSFPEDFSSITAFWRSYPVKPRPTMSEEYFYDYHPAITTTCMDSSCIIEGKPYFSSALSSEPQPYYESDEDLDPAAVYHIMQAIFFNNCTIRSRMLRDLLPKSVTGLKVESPTDDEWFATMRIFRESLFVQACDKAISWLVHTIQTTPDDDFKTYRRRMEFWNANLTSDDLIAIWCHLAPGVAIEALVKSPHAYSRWNQWLVFITACLVDQLFDEKILLVDEEHPNGQPEDHTPERPEFCVTERDFDEWIRCANHSAFKDYLQASSISSLPTEAPFLHQGNMVSLEMEIDGLRI